SGLKFSAFVRDITERREHEASLKMSEERFRTVARATIDTIWDWNLLTDELWWNEGMCTVFGYSKEELEPDSRSWKSRVHPDDRDRAINSAQHVIDSGAENWQESYRFRRKNGSYAQVKVRGFVVRDSSGKALRIVGGMDDVTQQMEYEARLAQQAELLDKAQDAIVVRDMENRITYWNRSAERLYGWTAEEALGTSVEALFYRDSSDYQDAMRILLKADEWSGEIQQRRKDGNWVTVNGAWSLVRDKEGRPQSVLAINTDITERLALEEQLRQSQRLESVGKLTGGVAHDFNNLLTVILGNAELMTEQLPPGDRLHRLAAMTKTAAQRGADLTHRLLAFARRQALEPQTTDINQLVVGMEDLLQRTLLENIDVEVVSNDDLWKAYIDRSQLESVLLNLAINAKDAMPRGGRLTMETANVQIDSDYAGHHADVVPGRYVMIAVSDTGEGILPEIIDRVFDPFFTTKEKGKGTGLGLSMAYGFVKQSRGHIKIYSEPGQGTTVKLYLPRAERAGDIVETQPPADSNFTGSEKVLIVEDDELVRQHAQSQLAEFGYKVTTARNGPEAMEIIKEREDIDLLFTDVIMSGGMNGRDLAEMAKRLRPRLKVLYTSGYTENAIVHHGRLDQGVHLLQKPYRRADLARKVRAALGDKSVDAHIGKRP
ncbi:MAG TPA: PAS domain S-box protein, partial [Gammaproteobacteria bacterium]